MSRRKTRRPPPRCEHCDRPITFFLAPTGSGWRPFDPTFVDSRDHMDRAYPVMGRKAWDFNELLAEIQVMRGCAITEAKDEVLDMDWYRLHRCGERIAAARARDDDRQEAR